jgi:hypothetical protein
MHFARKQPTMMRQINSLVAIAAAVVLIVMPPAAGQTVGQAISPDARHAAFERTIEGSPRGTVTFGRRAPSAGDEIDQSISLEMRLTTSMRQGNQLIQNKRTTMRSDQRRVVTTTSVDQGLTAAAEVRYLEATKHIGENDAAQTPSLPPSITQPVQGKTYHCKREGGEDGKLIVTDAAGHIPPTNELEIVAQNMDMIGRRNPLAEFLAGRSLDEGDTIAVPPDVADRLFYLGKRYGEVKRFDLTLRKSQAGDDAACAEFTARVEAASNDSSQMRLDVEGPLVVEVATCRAVRMQFSGPIGISETRGSYSRTQQLIGTGHMKMSITSAYRDAQ